jgi:hypothetical protein
MTAEIIAVLLYIVAIVPTPMEVTATGYTCSYHPSNAMATTPGMCIETFTGTSPLLPGVACPEQFLGRWFWIPGHGRLKCDDVPYHRTMNGLYHFDIRIVGSDGYNRAMAVSIGPMLIYLLLERAGQQPKVISHATSITLRSIWTSRFGWRVSNRRLLA